MYTAILETLCDQCRLKKQSDSGFKKEAWVAVLGAVQEAYTGSYIIEIGKVKSKADLRRTLALDGMKLPSYTLLPTTYRRNIQQ